MSKYFGMQILVQNGGTCKLWATHLTWDSTVWPYIEVQCSSHSSSHVCIHNQDDVHVFNIQNMSKTQKPTKNSCEDCRDGSGDKGACYRGWVASPGCTRLKGKTHTMLEIVLWLLYMCCDVCVSVCVCVHLYLWTHTHTHFYPSDLSTLWWVGVKITLATLVLMLNGW
jgi:hypothetical protein